MPSALARLEGHIKPPTDNGLPHLFPGPVSFVKLLMCGAKLEAAFDKPKKVEPPPHEKRAQALRRFQRALDLTPLEWRYVFAGLADPLKPAGQCLLHDDKGFLRVSVEVQQRIKLKTLGRREWLALCFSYFAFADEQPAANENWNTLRKHIDKGFDAVQALIARQRPWMRVVQEHRDVFGTEPGKKIADEVFAGKRTNLDALECIAQVPQNSWLWRNIFAIVLSRIFELDEQAFLARLPELMALKQVNPQYEDQILSACLTRYYRSSRKDVAEQLLKEAALERWGSPQVRAKQNLWTQFVEQPVCAMVIAWLAKEDLTHFFTLLKGERGVDQSRLFYWLRYANQMSFTRIVLGAAASTDMSPDFIDFRRKNKGRLSQLQNSTANNNAVIMQIGDYYFVEFSSTGNACYVYSIKNAPFNPESTYLSLTKELKDQFVAIGRWKHSPAPWKANEIVGWLENFDYELSGLGIYPGQAPTSQKPSASFYNKNFTVTGANKQAASDDDISNFLKYDFEALGCKVIDNRLKGGALKVKMNAPNDNVEKLLRRYGFKPETLNPLSYWRS